MAITTTARTTSRFQSTLPVWGATNRHGSQWCKLGFQSTLPVWGATRGNLCPVGRNGISIHAPRVGSDLPRPHKARQLTDFNPRSPCGERPEAAQEDNRYQRFQSTLPVWGATLSFSSWVMALILFQSTLPVWGATNNFEVLESAQEISIHAPRVGSDAGTCPGRLGNSHFNPRSPCGERPQIAHKTPQIIDFNPRSPCGERPAISTWTTHTHPISIHAPRVGSDKRRLTHTTKQ